MPTKMLRKRSCVSPEMSTEEKKRKLLTEDVKNTANEMKVRLHCSVVEKIVSMTKMQSLSKYIAQERVSRTFASALRSIYASEKLTLEISCDDSYSYSIDKSKSKYQLSLAGSSGFWYPAYLRVAKENLSQAVQQVFARFPQVSLNLNERLTAFMAEVLIDVLSKSSQEYKIYSLKIKFDFVRLHELIEKLSPNLKILILQIDNLKAYKSPEKIWRSVSMCTELIELSTFFKYSASCPLYQGNFSDLQECLKLLKIKDYRFNLRAKVVDAKWLSAAIMNNENLRRLHFTNHENHETIYDEAFLPILSRLDYLRIVIPFDEKSTGKKNSITSVVPRILSAMSKEGRLEVFTHIYDRREEEDDADYEQLILRVLKIYLAVSKQAARPIKTHLLIGRDFVYSPLQGNADDICNVFDIDELLKSMRHLRGLKTVQCGNRTRILYKNGSVRVKANETRDRDMIF